MKLSRGAVPGLASVFVRSGERCDVRVSGVADLAASKWLSAGSALRWYSLTKPVVAAAVLRAAEAGRLALDVPITQQLPAWSVENSQHFADVTPRELLSHASGLRDRQFHAATWFCEPTVARPDSQLALRGLLQRHRKLARGGSHYSNLGYVTLGALLEHVHQRSLESVLCTELLVPWGARQTTLCAAPDRELARGYMRPRRSMSLALRVLQGKRFFDGRHGALHVARRLELKHPAHGGLVGPISDLGRVLHGLLTGAGATTQPAVLSASARWLQATPLVACGKRRGESQTLGFCHLASAPEAPGEPVLFHGGRGPGFSAEMRLLPARGVAIGVVGNLDFDARSVAITALREELSR